MDQDQYQYASYPGPTTAPPARASTASPEQLQRSIRLLESLEARIEVLHRAGAFAEVVLPGVAPQGYRHPIGPNTEYIVSLLAARLKQDPALSQATAAAIHRFQTLAGLLDWPDGEPPARVPSETVLRHIYHLGHLPEQFKHEPMLSRIFPQPPASSRPETPRHAPAVDPETAAIRRATYLAASLAPRMAVASLALEALDLGRFRQPAARLTPPGRQALAIAASLRDDPARTEALRQALARYAELQAALKTRRVETLRELALPLGEVALTFRGHVLLEELFRRGPAGPPMERPD